jgi:hypothetical protein
MLKLELTRFEKSAADIIESHGLFAGRGVGPEIARMKVVATHT